MPTRHIPFELMELILGDLQYAKASDVQIVHKPRGSAVGLREKLIYIHRLVYIQKPQN